MFGHCGSWLRASVLALAGLLLASGVTWAHGGGGHGGGGHGGGHGGGGHGGGIGHVGGIGHAHGGGFHHGGIGYGYHHGIGVGAYGRGSFGVGSVYPYYGLGFGRGYGLGMTYGVYGGGYGLGAPFYGYGYSYGGGYPYYGGNYYGGNYSYGGYPYSGGYPYGGGASTLAGTPLSSYSMYYPSTAQQQTPPKDNLAHLLCIVPENAELWFNGTKTKQTGPQREFVSPMLAEGKSYAYDITARWNENGQTVERTRTAHVRANSWQTIDFTKPEPAADREK